MTNEEAYIKGMYRGIWLYAHWKDGVQYVGSCGKTLQRALTEVPQNVKEYKEMDLKDA